MSKRLLTTLLALLLALALTLPAYADGPDIFGIVNAARYGPQSVNTYLTISGYTANPQQWVNTGHEIVSQYGTAYGGVAFVSKAQGIVNAWYETPQTLGAPVAEIRTQSYVPAPSPSENFIVTWAAYSGYALRQFMAATAGAFAALNVPTEALYRLPCYYNSGMVTRLGM